MGGPSADEPPDKVKSAARSTLSNRDDGGRARPKRSFLPFHRAQRGNDNDTTSHNEANDATVSDRPAAAPPPGNLQAEGEKHSSLRNSDGGDASPEKRSIPTRTKEGSIRFVKHTRDALFSSWVNLLLVFVPIGIAADAVKLSPAIIFAMNAVAIVPLAGLLSRATESVADRLGDTWGQYLTQIQQVFKHTSLIKLRRLTQCLLW